MKGDSFFALIAGAAAGLTLGLLFAPEKGEETRRKVKVAAAEGWDEFVDAADEGWGKAKETFADVKEGAESATSRLRARARLARRDLKDLKETLSDQASDLKEETRLKILAQLDRLEKALSKDPEETEDRWNEEDA
ncbi:MAG: YtxH domain-containing protein [Bacteroidales bacterium]|nr:YtxH domain-containing protein [Bacteroidales bacterium]MBP3269579.1 YtxH domain-containing protein [Bacteroidales bacterium]